MKTTIVALILGLTIQTVSAGDDYQQAVALQEYCKLVADFARNSYDPPEVLREKFKQRSLDKFAKPGERNADVWRYAINYTYDKATDKENAYMMSWAYCMDNAN